MTKVITSRINKFIAQLLNRVGEYRPTQRNQGAIAFVQRGAGLGDKAWDMLPTALKAHEAHARRLLETRADDTGYRTLLIIGELLLPTAVKQLSYAIREADKKDAMRTRVVGYSLNALGKETAASEISADAWAEGTSQDLGDEATAHPGNDMGFETRDMENVEDDNLPVRFTADEIRSFIDELVKLLIDACLRADSICNAWRADYGSRPALPFLTVPRLDGSYTYAESVEIALQMLDAMDDEKAIRNRQQQMREIAASVDSWGLPTQQRKSAAVQQE